MSEYQSIYDLIKDYNINAKKSLGQNFLVDQNIISKIYAVIGNLENKNILEIGPGLGSLTNILLAKKPKEIKCIEKDTSFKIYLDKICAENSNISVSYEDAMKVDYNLIYKEKFSLIANLPYNIATYLVYNWLECDNLDEIYIMVQKEVAERMVAKPKSKDYGKLSILSQIRCDCEILFDISPNSFVPAPKITSSFIRLKKLPALRYQTDWKKLNQLVTCLFSFRRKMLRKSISGMSFVDQDIFNDDILPTMRAEDLSIENFCYLANKMQ
jgi:16S rRNA (adenine1518-N6/adenine1519-N6)-dimethyltransferase